MSDTCTRSEKSTSIPNFDKISQSTAEIKLLPVSERTAAILEFYSRFPNWPMLSACHFASAWQIS